MSNTIKNTDNKSGADNLIRTHGLKIALVSTLAVTTIYGIYWFRGSGSGLVIKACKLHGIAASGVALWSTFEKLEAEGKSLNLKAPEVTEAVVEPIIAGLAIMKIVSEPVSDWDIKEKKFTNKDYPETVFQNKVKAIRDDWDKKKPNGEAKGMLDLLANSIALYKSNIPNLYDENSYDYYESILSIHDGKVSDFEKVSTQFILATNRFKSTIASERKKQSQPT